VHSSETGNFNEQQRAVIRRLWLLREIKPVSNSSRVG